MKQTCRKGTAILLALLMMVALVPQYVYAVQDGAAPRSASLDLTGEVVSYTASDGTKNVDPSEVNITNSIEGWKWYLTGDEEKGYGSLTLELSGINLTTGDPVGIKLPDGATIVVLDDTTNIVKSTFRAIFGGAPTYGIQCLGNLTIKGYNGVLVATGSDTDRVGTSGVMAGGSLSIQGGNITAVGGETQSFSVMSTGLRASHAITITGGTIYAKTGYSQPTRAVYSDSWELSIDGMEAYQKIEDEYSAKATVENGVFVHDIVYNSQTYSVASNDVRITPLPSASFAGQGTAEEPYLITSKEELKEMAQFVNKQNSKYGNKHYRMTKDIILNEDLSGEREIWTPIGQNNKVPFSGVFDGGGRTISGLYMDGSASYAGLFGYVKSGMVKNVGVEGGQIYAASGDSYAGGIAAYNRQGRIEDCFNTSGVGGSQSGGITGYNDRGHIQDCSNSGSVSGIVAGGITGANDDAVDTVVNCYNTGIVMAAKGDRIAYAGGIAGVNVGSSIKNCYSAGTISSNGPSDSIARVGGIFGSSYNGTIEHAYWLDSSISEDTAYRSNNTGSEEAKTSAELKALTQTLNGNAAELEDEYSSLSPWKADANNQNGGYPLFGTTASNYTLTVSGGGTGATAGGSFTEGAAVPVNAGTRSGYTFAGWTTSGGGSFANKDLAETTFTMPGQNVTITAAWAANGSSGSGGHSSSGKSDKTNTTVVVINGSAQPAGKSETVTGTDGKSVTTVTVDSVILKSLLATERNGAKVTIPVAGSVSAAEGRLTGEMVKSMEDKSATLIIQKGASSYTLPAAEINISEISRQLGTNVSLSDITVSVKISEPSNTMAKIVENAEKGKGFIVVAPAVDFTITCTYGGKSVHSGSFNSYVERTVAIPSGVDPSKITTGIVVETNGTVYHVPTRVIVIDGKYYAVINSLTNSTYSVIWNPIEFSDMTNHWAKDSVNNMGSRMIVTGVGNNSYAPGRNMTRAEFSAVIVRALGLAPASGASSFSDVKASDWSNGYIETAVSYGIIKGYDDGRFGPNDTITREQAMTMLARAMKVTGLDTGLTDKNVSELVGAYTDGASVSAYAKESVAACLETGITSGRGNHTIVPKSSITRAEVAAMAERLLKKSDLI